MAIERKNLTLEPSLGLSLERERSQMADLKSAKFEYCR